MAPPAINMCLLGKTGSGKSATGNSILSQRAFQSGSSTTSITTEVTAKTTNVQGRTVTVVDGPGVGDTRFNREEDIKTSIKSFEKIMSACADGYHAMLLFFRYGTRYTAEDHSVLAALKELLGQDFVRKHAVLVVTCGDVLEREMKDDEEGNRPPVSLSSYFSCWLREQTAGLGTLSAEVEGRVVLFDNKTNDQRALEAQRANLFEAVDNLINRGMRYSQGDFLACEMSRLRILVGTRLEKVQAETKVKVDALSTKLNLAVASPSSSSSQAASQISSIETLQREVQDIRTAVEREDKGTGALKPVLEMVDIQKTSLHNALHNAKTLLEQRKRQEREAEEIRRQEAELRRQQEEMQRQAELRRREEARKAEERRRLQEEQERRKRAEAEERARTLQSQIEEEERRKRRLAEEEAALRRRQDDSDSDDECCIL